MKKLFHTLEDDSPKCFIFPQSFNFISLRFLINGVMIFPLIVSIESRIYVSNLTRFIRLSKIVLECASKNGSRGIQTQVNFFVISFFSRVMEKSKFMEYLGNDHHRQGVPTIFSKKKGTKAFEKWILKCFGKKVFAPNFPITF